MNWLVWFLLLSERSEQWRFFTTVELLTVYKFAPLTDGWVPNRLRRLTTFLFTPVSILYNTNYLLP